jgi:predicted transcriptional regulator
VLSTHDSISRPTEVPSLVKKLAPGEGEIASIVYELGGCTAKEVQVRLSKPLTIETVRSVLRRLEQKGIMIHRRRGTYRTFVYVPAITNDYVRQRMLLRLAEDHFEGSLPSLAATLAHLLDARPPARR